MGCVQSSKSIKTQPISTNRNNLSTSQNIKVKNLITQIDTKVEDNYKVISKLGKGAFGSVYKVVHFDTGIIRAMKVIKKSSISLQEDDQSFSKEINILIGLEHPHIIKIFEYFIDEINYYLITEYISGGELYEVISGYKDFNENKVKYVMSQILQAVNYLHNNSIVHRDLKPENILVEKVVQDSSSCDKFNIKLIDFGTSNYIVDKQHLTLKVGSPFYMAPEVLKKDYNQKCDIWSAGIIMHVLLTGTPPFTGRNQEEIFDRIKKGNVETKMPEFERISDSGKDLLLKMLQLNMDKRLSAAECLEHPWLKDTSFLSAPLSTVVLKNVIENICKFQVTEKLQQVTIAYIVHFLYSNKEIEELKKVFKELDTNKDGSLTYTELFLAFRKYFGASISELKLHEIIKDIDSNSDGVISYEEFLRVAVNQANILDEDNLKKAFDRFDTDKDGKLSKEELKAVLYVSDFDYINELLQRVDQNKDGYLSYSEFKALMSGVLAKTPEL